jgi:hypothetical protein
MKILLLAGLSAGVATALLAPSSASASSTLSLSFTGAASSGFVGDVFEYLDASPPPVSFQGQPVTIGVDVAGLGATPFITQFSVSWSNQTYAFPYLTHAAGAGELENGSNDTDVTFFSTVALSDSGGSISIVPSEGYIATFDGDFDLNLTYATTGSHPVGSTFTDGATGSGTISAAVTFNFDPTIGPFDADSSGGFTVDSVTAAAVPEPGAWMLLIAGFGGVGGVLRGRRRRAAGSPA